jgi:protoporphyrinogen IX oxidase
MTVLYLKALHIIFVVTWFAGLFYIVRLFIYHTEAHRKPEPAHTVLTDHFRIAEKRLWFGITFPSMVLTYIFGFWMAYEMFGWNYPDWLLLKLAFVLGLTIYHFVCHVMFRNLQKGVMKYSSMQLRMWNEVTTLFLFAIVFIVVLKGAGNWLWGLAGLAIFAALLMIAIRLYKKYREKKER